MNGNISKEGITADLEAMSRVGVGGGYIFNVTVGIPAGPVRFMSDEWRDMVKHAAREADRLGIELGLHNCAGWSSSGGPWNTVENSMQMLTTSETPVRGPGAFRGTLARPPARQGYYRDVAILAFRARTETAATPTMKAGTNAMDASLLQDGDWSTSVQLPLPEKDKPQAVDLTYKSPVAVQSFNLVTGLGRNNHGGELQVSHNGRDYVALRPFTIQEYGGNSLEHQFPFVPVTARHFRVLFTRPSNKAKVISLAELGLESEPRLDGLAGKAGYVREFTAATRPGEAPLPGAVRSAEVIDLTSRAKGGALEWDVPAGAWRILRVGHTTTASKNHPAPSEGTGLECDKLSKKALEAHWDGMMGQVVADLGPLAGKSLKSVEIDSWEIGAQNYTPGFLDEFRKRRGYDPLPYFPALTGRVVDSPSVSERFLWDWRRTITDLFAENHFAHMQTLAERHGMELHCEPYGSNFDYMQAGGMSAMPIGEFWLGRPTAHRHTIKLAASTAHTYGKRIAGAEAFTTRDDFGKWMNHPYKLKSYGDLMWCEGINKFVFHRYAHQPWTHLVPGMTYGECGIHFERSNTWWDDGAAWLKYIARSQHLLQEGQFAADVLWFIGDDAPNNPGLRADLRPTLPSGYDYDACDAYVVQNRTSVKDRRIVLPDGTSYAYLLLAEREAMTLATARKIRELARGGATVIGPRPLRTTGLTDYPAADAELRTIADELWGADASVTGGVREVGKGRVIWGRSFEAIFEADRLRPDFDFEGTAALHYIHRRAGDADVYFVAHEETNAAEATATFRISGKRPEFWHPDTGEIEPCPVYRQRNGRTEIPMQFDPAGSVFVVFRGEPESDPIVAASPRLGSPEAFDIRRGTLLAFQPCAVEIEGASGEKSLVRVDAVPAAIEIEGPWAVEFEPGRGAPARAVFEKLIPWNEHEVPGIRYFSGHATYRARFETPADLPAGDRKVFLDLGDVQVIADVTLNGKPLGTLWKPPYRVDATGALKAGENRLEIRVVNLWINRLIGDEQFPPDAEYTGPRGVLKSWPEWLTGNTPRPEPRRMTFSTYRHWTKDDALAPSGLVGPVRCIPAVVKPLNGRDRHADVAP